MVSSSVGMWVRADWRRRYLSLVALALVAGISFAVAVTAFAGARRTASSFDRLREATHAYDNGVAIDAPGASPTGDDSYDQATVDRIRNLPQIETVGELVSYLAATPDDSWEVSIGAPVDDVLGTRIASDRCWRGRMPATDRADEVVVNEPVAQTGVDVGGVLTLGTVTPEQQRQIIAGDPHAFDHGLLGPELHLRVVGVVRGASDVVGRADPTVIGTPAFDREYPDASCTRIGSWSFAAPWSHGAAVRRRRLECGDFRIPARHVRRHVRGQTGHPHDPHARSRVVALRADRRSRLGAGHQPRRSRDTSTEPAPTTQHSTHSDSHARNGSRESSPSSRPLP